MPPNKPLPDMAPPAGNPQKGGKPQEVRLKIDGQWYDLTQWGKVHPGGADILQHLHGLDATDAFYSLHSKEAVARLKRMPTCSPPSSPAKFDSAPVEKMHANFRQLRKELEEEGFFVRNPLWDSFYIGAVLFLLALGTYISRDHPWIATFLIGVAMEQAGWLGHDYVHGRGTGSYIAGRILGGGINGFSSTWWSDKHNTHHVYPNRVGVDRDIQMNPVFYLWFPDVTEDVPTRPYQHYYFYPVCTILYLSWRQQSLFHSIVHRKWDELAIMAVGYYWLLFCLPWYVALGSCMLGGFLVAVVVTASHQSEELLTEDRPYSFVLDQFLTTRNAWTNNPVMNWLWGGMQYQLEHHLFPTMPKYRYREVSQRLKKFAKDNGIVYKQDGVWQLLARNLSTIKKYSAVSA